MTSAAGCTTKLVDLVDETIGGLWGRAPDSRDPDDTDVLVLRGADFRQWDTRRACDAAPRRVPAKALAKRQLRRGDLVLEVSGGSPAQPVGRVLVVDQKALDQVDKPLICSNFCRKITLVPEVDPFFIKRQLDSLYQQGHTLQYQTSTTNIRNLRVDDFIRGTSVTVPDLATQAEITNVLDAIETRRASVGGRLNAARLIVERVRTAVLADACSGRLTADWRGENGDSVDSLVEALRSAASVRRSPIAQPEPTLLGALPETWQAVTLDLLVERIEAGKSVRAEGRPAELNEWGVIKVSSMSWGSFLERENKVIVDPALINTRYEIHTGDLLISRANTTDLVGATVYVEQTRPRLLLSDKSLRLVPHTGIDKAWLNFALSSPASRSQLADRATGTSESMRNLSQPKILATTLALPPLAEQRELVRRAAVALASADRLIAATVRADAAVEKAARAALAKAFSGRLVLGEAGAADSTN